MRNAILIVDDSEADALSLQRLLRTYQVTNPIHIVSNGVQAIAYLAGNGPYNDRIAFPQAGLVFLDLRMPVADGFHVLEWIRHQAEVPKLMVAVVSGLERIEDLQRAYEMGAHTFLSKPCRSQDLDNMIRILDCYWSVTPIHTVPTPPLTLVPDNSQLHPQLQPQL